MIKAFLRSRSGVVGLVLIALLAAAAVLAPSRLGTRASTLDVFNAGAGPSSGHWLGTDRLGRDTLARLLEATRLSIGLALAATGIAAVLGITLGSVTAVLPSAVRSVALRAIDALIAFPSLLIARYKTDQQKSDDNEYAQNGDQAN